MLYYLILHILSLPLETDNANEFEEIWGGEANHRQPETTLKIPTRSPKQGGAHTSAK